MNKATEAKRWDHNTLIRFIPRFNELKEQARGGVPACLDLDPTSDSPIWTLHNELRDALAEGGWLGSWDDKVISPLAFACYEDPGKIDELCGRDIAAIIHYHMLKNMVCEGHFGAMVFSGQIERMLERVRKLGTSSMDS